MTQEQPELPEQVGELRVHAVAAVGLCALSAGFAQHAPIMSLGQPDFLEQVSEVKSP